MAYEGSVGTIPTESIIVLNVVHLSMVASVPENSLYLKKHFVITKRGNDQGILLWLQY